MIKLFLYLILKIQVTIQANTIFMSNIERGERCKIPHRAFYISVRKLKKYNTTTTSTNIFRQELLEKLLNQKTGKASYLSYSYYYVPANEWVDLSCSNKLNSWGSALCYNANDLSRDLNDTNKSKRKKTFALQTVRDFLDVYGYYPPMNAGDMVKNDINRVKLIHDSDKKDTKKQTKYELERKIKELKREWNFLRNIYSHTSLFGNEKNYKKLVDSNTLSGPIFKCRCVYHSRFN